MVTQLRGGEGDVEARAMLALAVARAPEPSLGPDHMAPKKLLEGAGHNRLAGMQSQGNRARAMPGAGLSVPSP